MDALGTTLLSLSDCVFEKFLVYPNLAMRKLFPLLAMMSLVGTAAPPNKAVPTIDPDYSCTAALSANCEVNSDFSLNLSGLDTKKAYVVAGVNPNFGSSINVGGGILEPTSDTLTVSDNLGAWVGTWTFTLYQVNPHTGRVMATFDSITITFD
jgi:hypothetical protein